MTNDWKDRLGVVFSTDPDFKYEHNKAEEPDTLPPEKQRLKVKIDRKRRKGKVVTIVSGFVGRAEDLKELARLLKTKCGVGGTAKDGEIIIQGEWLEKIKIILTNNNYGI